MAETARPAGPMTTARLLLRPLAIDDAPAIQRHFPQWEIVRFLNGRVPWPFPPDGALTYLRDLALPAMARGEEWHWSLRLKERPDALIGVISLMAREDNNRGFWLGLPWQGQGLMLEAVEAVTGFWFEALGREVLRAPKAVANHASRRVSERTGMRVIRRETQPYVSGEHPTEIWEITRAEWRARRSPLPAPQGEGNTCYRPTIPRNRYSSSSACRGVRLSGSMDFSASSTGEGSGGAAGMDAVEGVGRFRAALKRGRSSANR